jgi:superfamily II DNA or RNA helicase
MSGYIYMIWTVMYMEKGFIKIGSTFDYENRYAQYKTYSPDRWTYLRVYRLIDSSYTCYEIDEKLRTEWATQYHHNGDGGTEWYHSSPSTSPYITPEIIEEIFANKGVKVERVKEAEDVNFYKKFEMFEMSSLSPSLSPSPVSSPTIPTTPYVLYPVQEEIKNKLVDHLIENDKGILQVSCGVGKTLLSLLTSHTIGSKTIVVGVPNNELLRQWSKVVENVFGKDCPKCIVNGSMTMFEISTFLSTFNDKNVVITTYHSSVKVKNACEKTGFIFDMKINDEVHHLTSPTSPAKYDVDDEKDEEKRSFIEMLAIPSKKQLSLTATLKVVEKDALSIDSIISNDDVSRFGEIVVKRDLLWSIKNDLVCDYVIQTIKTDEDRLDDMTKRFGITEQNDARLFFAAYLALKSMSDGHSHHLLVYCNTRENAKKIDNYLGMLADWAYHSNYDGEMSSNVKANILSKFSSSPYGVLTCVYCLGEGFDLPMLDGQVFAENMTSSIRIVQSALRGARKDRTSPGKVNKIILPMVYDADWTEGPSDFEKVRAVIREMSLEDSSIVHKIRVSKVDIDDIPEKKEDKKEEEKKDDRSFGEYDEELTEKLRLCTIKRSMLGVTYREARRIVKESGVKTKEEYAMLCENDVRLSPDPEEVYGKAFLGWVDYLCALDESIQYYTLSECRQKVNEWCILHPSQTYPSKIMEELNKIDNRFPPNGLWADYYKVSSVDDIVPVKISLTPQRKLRG